MLAEQCLYNPTQPYLVVVPAACQWHSESVKDGPWHHQAFYENVSVSEVWSRVGPLNDLLFTL